MNDKPFRDQAGPEGRKVPFKRRKNRFVESSKTPAKRPKLKYKHVKKAPAPKPTPEQKQAAAIRRTEQKFGINPLKVCNLLLKNKGLVNDVCIDLGMGRETLLRYIEKHEVCIESLEHARNTMGDVAEKKLFELIEAGDVRCILYYLSTVHRSRGYGMNVANAPEANSGRGPVFVETVNIVGVPSGTYLPPAEVLTIDNQ
jgi:hypothetical protein